MATTITRRQIREGAAADLGLFQSVTADTVDTTDHTVVISDVRKKSPDSQRLMDAFLTARESASTGNTYRRIIKGWLDDTPATLQLDGGPDSLSNTNSAGIYFGLSPEEWNNCINEVMEELYRVVEVVITLDTSENEYLMDDQTDADDDDCTYIQRRTQILGVEVRSGSGIISREFWPGVRWIEDNDQVTCHLTYVPNVSGAELVVKVRKPYAWRDSLLSTDQATTTCPYKLAIMAVQVKGLHLMYKNHGRTKMREQFGQAMVVAERELAQMLQVYLPAMRPQSYELDEGFEIDVPGEMTNWRW